MRRRRKERLRLAGLVLAGALSMSRAATAQAEPPAPVQREAELTWDTDRGLLYLDIAFRDVLDANIRGKLSRGLPTTVVLTATVQRAGSNEPISTTTQTCRITWHVWEEAYYLEIVRPGATQTRWTTTLEGVLRRCAEAHRLLAGDATQVSPAAALYARGSIQINPVSPEVLQKLQRWVMRPSSTGTAAPGDALFSTFTGLFLQRIGDAEREVRFFTRPKLPVRFSSKQEEKRP
ncbi:MAG TPA: hypothetical protein VNN72_07860 [Polyangiaceae bacterium]|nr:hypothetical protein [Polyangiaceae bacterium]